MKDGFIKVGAAIPEIRVGDCEYNADRIIECIVKAYEDGVRTMVLPELCVTGCSCKETFMHSNFLNSVQTALEHIVGETAELGIVCAVGAPVRFEGALRNCAVVFSKGEILGIVPERGVRGEKLRYFAPGGKSPMFVCKELGDISFEVVVGSDKPVTGANIVLRMTAEPGTVDNDDYIRAAASVLSYENHCVLVSANAGEGESTACCVYTGGAMIYENGKPLAEAPSLGSGCITADADVAFIAFERRRCGFVPVHADEVREFSLDIVGTALSRRFSAMPFVPGDDTLGERCGKAFAMQCLGLEKRMKHTGAEKLVIGVSGGLDSTLALLVCTKTAEKCGMKRSDVVAVTMPCFGTTSRTKSNAEKLAGLLGTTLMTVDISEAVKLHFRDIGHDAGLQNSAFENAQARERTQVLMDIANDVNGLVVGTGDLSELALGWATFGGDQMSMYGVNAGVPKTLIQRIVSYFADSFAEPELAAVLRDIVDTPISPELLPGQKTEDSVGPYELHDFFLYHMIRRGSSPSKIYRIALDTFADRYDGETIKKWLAVFVRRFFSQQFKRSCSPDGVRIGSVSLSPHDLRLPSDISGRLWVQETEEL